jgi:hypothetical protein
MTWFESATKHLEAAKVHLAEAQRILTGGRS